MKIGVDAFSLKGNRTGVGNYLYNNLKRMIVNSPNDEFYLFVKNDFDEFAKYSNVKFIKFKSKIKKLNGTVWLLYFAFLFKKYSFDVFWSPNFFIPLWLPKNTRKIVTVHDLSHIVYPQFMSKKALLSFRVNFKRSLRKADSVIAVSNFTRDEIQKYYRNIPIDKIHVIYNGIENQNIDFSNHETEIIKEKYGINKRFFLSLSTLVPRKNIICILKAFSQYLETKNDAILVLVGRKDKDTGMLSSYIKEKKMDNNVIFTGFVLDSEIPWFYKNCDLYINSSLYEGFGIPNIEAYAYSKRLLLSNIPVYKEIFSDLVEYFNPNKPDELAELLLKTKSQEKDLGFTLKFNWNTISIETLKVIKNH